MALPWRISLVRCQCPLSRSSHGHTGFHVLWLWAEWCVLHMPIMTCTLMWTNCRANNRTPRLFLIIPPQAWLTNRRWSQLNHQSTAAVSTTYRNILPERKNGSPTFIHRNWLDILSPYIKNCDSLLAFRPEFVRLSSTSDHGLCP